MRAVYVVFGILMVASVCDPLGHTVLFKVLLGKETKGRKVAKSSKSVYTSHFNCSQ